MNKEIYKVKYNEYLDLFNQYSEKVFSSVETPNNLANAMKYSLFAGGKRIRPVMMLAFADIIGYGAKNVLPFALALECIHTYSLIHDDLPALDNDILRRGNPTCHVKFNESTAILAGDALLNFAFEHVLENISSKKEINALLCLAKLSGYSGMLSGQQSDIEMEKKGGDESTLLKIHENKTCKLLTAPFVIPAILIGDTETINMAQEFGFLSGVIFQFTDDLLDVLGNESDIGKTTGKDLNSGKLTSVKLYGVDGVKSKIKEYVLKTENIIKSIDNSGFLKCFISSVTDWIYEN
ncbi:MAG: polyprenyl synthetase family protein [Clostridiales bacterium]|nr:polyprenyl synthetase family protein [Clostridiales bacterium]